MEQRREVHFEYRGLSFSIMVNPEDPDHLVKNDFIQDFIFGGGSLLIYKKEGKTVVNWKHFFNSHGVEIQGWHVFFLVAAGVLSKKASGNWEIKSGSRDLNLYNYDGEIYFFTRREDVVEYARFQYGQAVFNWEVRKIDEVISRQEIMGE